MHVPGEQRAVPSSGTDAEDAAPGVHCGSVVALVTVDTLVGRENEVFPVPGVWVQDPETRAVRATAIRVRLSASQGALVVDVASAGVWHRARSCNLELLSDLERVSRCLRCGTCPRLTSSGQTRWSFGQAAPGEEGAAALPLSMAAMCDSDTPRLAAAAALMCGEDPARAGTRWVCWAETRLPRRWAWR